jgi:hypothetical protein
MVLLCKDHEGRNIMGILEADLHQQAATRKKRRMAAWIWRQRTVYFVITVALLAAVIVFSFGNHSNGARQIFGGNQENVNTTTLHTSSAATGPLHVDQANPRYFTDGNGKAILLTGAHTWYTMQDAGWTDPPPIFDYETFLNFAQSNGQNFFRTFIWEETWRCAGISDNCYGSPMIYQRSGQGNALDGKPRFDLTKFNQAYFDRIRARTIEAGQRGFYVSLMLFEGFSVMDKDGGNLSPWPGHPFNKANNINGLDGDPDHHGDGRDIQTLRSSQVLAYQEAYVAKLIDTVNDLDNVLFEICNEANGQVDGTVSWENHFIDFVHSYEAKKPKQHPVGFTVLYPGGDNSAIFASNADWVSPNDSGSDTYKTDPPAADGSKVIIADTDHLWGLGGDRAWAWKSFTRGLNPIFMDPYSDYTFWNSQLNPNDPSCVSLRANLGYILKYAKRMNLEAMTPQKALCSTGYCLANPATNGAEYLIYLPSGATFTGILEKLGEQKRTEKYFLTDSAVRVDLSSTPGELTIEWFNPSTGVTMAGGTVSGGAKRAFIAPFTGDAVLYLYSTLPPENKNHHYYLPGIIQQ